MAEQNQKSVNENQELAGAAIENLAATEAVDGQADLAWRPLKFRAWDKVKKQWIEGGYGFHILGESMLMGGLFQDYGLLELNNIDITQFTGILDKGGFDVYEGDIVRHHKYGGDHVVAWHADSTGFFVGEQSWPLAKLCTPHIEVVANIYGEKNESAY